MTAEHMHAAAVFAIGLGMRNRRAINTKGRDEKKNAVTV